MERKEFIEGINKGKILIVGHPSMGVSTLVASALANEISKGQVVVCSYDEFNENFDNKKEDKFNNKFEVFDIETEGYDKKGTIEECIKIQQEITLSSLESLKKDLEDYNFEIRKAMSIEYEFVGSLEFLFERPKHNFSNKNKIKFSQNNNKKPKYYINKNIK